MTAQLQRGREEGLLRRLSSFLIVGALGFLADAAALALFTGELGIDPYLARVLSIAFALAVTWLLNRSFTFGASRRHAVVEGARYGSVGLGTSIVNFAVYSALLAMFPALQPLAALAAGSVVAMALSYLGYSRLVFDR